MDDGKQSISAVLTRSGNRAGGFESRLRRFGRTDRTCIHS